MKEKIYLSEKSLTHGGDGRLGFHFSIYSAFIPPTHIQCHVDEIQNDITVHYIICSHFDMHICTAACVHCRSAAAYMHAPRAVCCDDDML